MTDTPLIQIADEALCALSAALGPCSLVARDDLVHPLWREVVAAKAVGVPAVVQVLVEDALKHQIRRFAKLPDRSPNHHFTIWNETLGISVQVMDRGAVICLAYLGEEAPA